MSNLEPAETFSPGEFLREEMAERGWTQTDLSRILRRPVQAVNLIVSGKKSITARTARELAAALGTSPELWLNLQTASDLSVTSVVEAPIRRRARAWARASRARCRYRRAAGAAELAVRG